MSVSDGNPPLWAWILLSKRKVVNFLTMRTPIRNLDLAPGAITNGSWQMKGRNYFQGEIMNGSILEFICGTNVGNFYTVVSDFTTLDVKLKALKLNMALRR
ncbi:hypothetical protein CDAR_205061 [Caerostris darwini]|uniref:Uncharacterized protein n=1 Tax=Caerostris darwini TaxID=1538125 RepID=A0AAV4PUZ4_9ARAC|nr:hypothetical protein CDAR_205061 [Caerostris darwini]